MWEKREFPCRQPVSSVAAYRETELGMDGTAIKTVVGRSPLRPALLYLKEFSETTTLHGIRHIGLSNRHVVEVVLWTLCEISAIYGSYHLMHDSWTRYNENPTVVTVQKDYRQWHLPFPSATFCYVNPVDEDLARDYVKRKWNVSAGEKFEYYFKFINKLANTTYENLEDMAPYVNDAKLMNIDIIDLMMKVHAELRYKTTIFSVDYQNISFQPVLTEMGICYTFSGIITDYLTPDNKVRAKGDQLLPSCNFLNSLCYARAENLPRIVSYYVHYAKDVPTITDKYYSVLENMERDTTFTFWEMTSAPELKRLSPSQRQCRFMSEPMDDTIPVYSYNVCRMICRRRLALELCKCSPHFYPYSNEMKICDVKGLHCLSNHKTMLMSLEKDNSSIDCGCLMQCDDIKLFLDRNSKRTWSYPVPNDIRFRWAIDKYSKTRLRRDVIYSFEDLLATGGVSARGVIEPCAVSSGSTLRVLFAAYFISRFE